MSDLLAHLIALGSLASAFGLAGYALERGLLRDAPLGHLRMLARAVLGVLAWMAALFWLTAAGALATTPVLGLAALCVAGAGLARIRFGGASAGEATGVGFVLTAGVFTSPFLLLALRPEVSWDASAYHLTLAKHFLAAGGFEPLPFSVYAHWPLATELLYAAALAIQDYTLAKALHFGFGLATLWALYLGARNFQRAESGWLAAPLTLANPIFLFELGVAYVELAYAFFFAAGLLFMIQWKQCDGASRSALWLAGLCCGGMAGLKGTGIVGAGALALLALPPIIGRLRRGESRAAGGDALALGLPIALLWGPWLAKSALATGNPLYPLLYGVFGGPDWSAALSEQLTGWLRSIGMGRELLDYALLPVRVIVSGGPGYDRFGGQLGLQWLVLLPLALAFVRRPVVGAVLAASGSYFVLWALGSQQVRFLIPLLGPLSLAAAIAWSEAVARLAPARSRRVLLAVGLGCAVLLALHTARLPLERAARTLGELAVDPERRRAAASTPADHFVATLPPDAKLLLLNTNQAFFLERAYLADSFFEASQIADWLSDAPDAAAVHARLRERAVTHVLIERRDWGIAWPAGLRALLADRSLLKPRFRSPDGRVEIFELR